MQYVKENQKIDGVAEDQDIIEIEIQNDIGGGSKLYVHVNGITHLRIGRIENITITDNR